MPTTERQQAQGSEILYSESQRVPLTWWLLGALLIGLLSWQAQMQREWYWGIVAGVVVSAAVIWSLISLSSTKVMVVQETTGERWLYAGAAKLPADVVSRTLVIPPTAKQAAMGRQLDPAAYVLHKTWIPTMAMLVLDDPDDPTPYWLISSKEPQELLEALDRPIF